jgi:hypothetical protein
LLRRFWHVTVSKNYKEVIMAQVWHDDFQPLKGEAWKVPVKWLHSQLLQCSLNGDEDVVVAVKDKKLYIQGYRTAENEVKLVRSWAEEFPPWGYTPQIR